jgi:2-keto-3-deoxy-L-rhamnonate aldolase RhmA
MNPIKDSLARGEVCLGTMMQFGHPGIAEVLANAGYSWIAVDLEHSDIGTVDFTQVCRGMYGRGALPLARVRENDPLAIRQVLDMGAAGVLVPMVGTAQEAAAAAAATRYPPQGVRGFSFHRANDWGTRFAEHVRDADNDVLLLVMIETRPGVENIRAILETEGVDGIFIGPYDLSGSFGVAGQLDHPVIQDAIAACLAACREAGKTAGIHIADPSPGLVQKRIDSGFRFIGLGYDSVFLNLAARNALAMAHGKD